MNASKSTLLAATAVASLLTSTGAYAGAVAYPAATINGNGASSIAVVLNKTERCLGAKTSIGFTDNTTVAYPDHNYTPVTVSVSNPAWNCGNAPTQEIQPDLTYQYTSTGSTAGRANWANFNVAGITPNNPLGFTGNIQYAFSDSALTDPDLTTYTANANNATNKAGAAIQVPFYVLPIALAYSPVYGKRDNGTPTPTPLSFNVKSTYVKLSGDGNVAGGLRLKRTTYCAIMQGTIQNWNNAAITADNGNQSLMDANDDPARWASAGVPIKLVGRNDGSGTTNLFSRHLAAVCGTLTPNDFVAQGGGNDRLPVARRGTAIYDRNTAAITAGSETLGLFGRVDGSDGIATVVGQTIPNPAPGSGTTNLSGYFGYVGGDFVRPATTGTTVPLLHSAALQKGTTVTFLMPTPANATAAFGTAYLPPQSATTGKYTTTPPSTSVGNRTDPLAWAQAPNDLGKLASNTTGYPIVGTTNALLYTCYSTPAKRLGIVALAALQFGKFTTGKTATKFPVALVNSTAKGPSGLQIGVLSQNGLSNMPAAWKNAIWETFFSKTVTGTNPSTLNLWIQDKLPTTTAGISAIQGNSTCTAGAGA